MWARAFVVKESAIEFIVEFVLTALWEILLQVLGEFLLEFGFRSMGESFRRRRRPNRFMSGVGVVLLGGLAGVLTSLIWPARMVRPGPLPGISLLASPMVTGVLMARYGKWQQDRGGRRSFVATFWGGAMFAFSMALVRFIWVGL